MVVSLRREALFAGACALWTACAPPYQPKKLEMEPIGTLKNVPTTPIAEAGDGGVTAPNSGTILPNNACTAVDFESLEDALRLCEVPVPRAAEVPSIKDKLEVKVEPSPKSAAPGGRVEVVITLRNRTSDPLPLFFTGDPIPRFDVEAFDAKGRRADLPATKWPGYPKGVKPEPRDAKAAKVTLEKNGTAKVRVPWDAVKTRWAPDRARSWDGRGYPRVPSGVLGPGKYSLRVVLPVVGEVEAPKATVDITGS